MINSIGAKFQTTFVVCFFLNKYRLEKKFLWKVERLNYKQHRSRWDGSLWAVWSGSMLFAKSLLSSPVAVKELMPYRNEVEQSVKTILWLNEGNFYFEIRRWLTTSRHCRRRVLYVRNHNAVFAKSTFFYHVSYFVWSILKIIERRVRRWGIGGRGIGGKFSLNIFYC